MTYRIPRTKASDDVAVDFTLFTAFKHAENENAYFDDLKIMESYVKINNVMKKAVILTENWLTFEKAKEFCEYHKAELPKMMFYHKPIAPLKPWRKDEFWVE